MQRLHICLILALIPEEFLEKMNGNKGPLSIISTSKKTTEEEKGKKIILVKYQEHSGGRRSITVSQVQIKGGVGWVWSRATGLLLSG